ncbi:putative bacteriophage tail protein [Hyphomicrobium sp. 1Nfss2.1]|uniref:hypothetical protein n=1 Tax=Hyphomicrobium sp. 1Nfss2.1 TaxID=3413936 RepID=UPI003C79C259
MGRWLAQFWRRRFDKRYAEKIPIPDGLERETRFVDRLFRAAETKGLIPQIPQEHSFHRMDFLCDGVQVHCRLRTPSKLVTVRKHSTEIKEYKSTGQMIFRIVNVKHSDIGTNPEWDEGKIGPLRTNVKAIADALVLAGRVVVRRELERQEREKHSERREADRRLQEQNAMIAARCKRALMSAADNYQMAISLRALIAELEKKAIDGSDVVGNRSIPQWLAWARQQTDSIDPLSKELVSFFEEINRDGEGDEPD